MLNCSAKKSNIGLDKVPAICSKLSFIVDNCPLNDFDIFAIPPSTPFARLSSALWYISELILPSLAHFLTSAVFIPNSSPSALYIGIPLS